MPRQSNSLAWHSVSPCHICTFAILCRSFNVCGSNCMPCRMSFVPLFWLSFYNLTFMFFFLHKLSPLGAGRFCCWSWCGWCEPCNAATLLQCPRLSLSGLPPPTPIHRNPPSRGVLSEGQFLWTQTTVPFVLPGLGMHSAIFCCVSANPTGCQTWGPYSYASSFLSLAFFRCLSVSLWQCQYLSHWWRVLRRHHLCGLVILNLSGNIGHYKSTRIVR